MTYDLAIFNPETSPKEPTEFKNWYLKQGEWTEPHDYDDPSVCTKAMRAWYLEMTNSFPDLNTVDDSVTATEDFDLRQYMADYSIGSQIIYVAFQWSKQKEAYDSCLKLAKKHGVVFFDVSAEIAGVYFPTNDGDLVRTFSIEW